MTVLQEDRQDPEDITLSTLRRQVAILSKSLCRAGVVRDDRVAFICANRIEPFAVREQGVLTYKQASGIKEDFIRMHPVTYGIQFLGRRDGVLNPSGPFTRCRDVKG